MVVHRDCVHFRGDVPCAPSKEHGVVCDGCSHFRKTSKRVLVIKLDAMGDVLRTTCILRPIRAAWPDATVTWITAPTTVPLLRGLPSVVEVLPADHRALALLSTTRFDLALGLDAGPESARLTTLAQADEKRGFGVDERGAVRPLNAGAEAWFQLGLFDALKQANRRTYQELIVEAAGLAGPPGPIELALAADERRDAARRAVEWERRWPRIGLNLGAGDRWRSKQWPLDHFRALTSSLLAAYPSSAVLLYGGPSEREAMDALSGGWPPGRVLATGCDNSPRAFAALIGECDVMVTVDTLAMHVALAMRRRVVALFGPTSAAEIELYGLGAKLTPPGGCGCFYRPRCSRVQPCLATIAPETVLAAISVELESLKNERVAARAE